MIVLICDRDVVRVRKTNPHGLFICFFYCSSLPMMSIIHVFK